LSGCGQTCLFQGHALTVNWQQIGSMTVTRQSVGGICCYKGTATIRVYGSLQIDQTYTGGPPGCDAQSQTNTYTFDRDVCATITVSCGGVYSCGWTPATPPGWTHTIHIGDFLVTCSHDQFAGDCDTCLSVNQIALRCVGGTVSYLSDLKALNTITKAQTGCLGYYARGDCGTETYAAMHANTAVHGPFGIVSDEECSEQDEYQSCTLGVRPTGNVCLNRFDCDNLSTPYLCIVDTLTKSFCGGTDESVGPNANCLTDILQTGCGQITWLYT